MKEIEEEGRRAIQYFDQLNKNPAIIEFEKNKENTSDKFKEACEPKVNKKIELPYSLDIKDLEEELFQIIIMGRILEKLLILV